MKKKLVLLVAAYLICAISIDAQVTDLAPNYKVIDIGSNSYGDYTRSLILLHEIYNTTLIDKNYAVGTIKAMRGNTGSFDRIDVAQINSSSAYNGINASVISLSSLGLKWALKTAIYNGKKYLAVDVPYSAAYHNWGYQFVGWTTSTGESMKCISYQVNGQSVNQDVLSNITDFSPTIYESHDVANFVLNSSVVNVSADAPYLYLTSTNATTPNAAIRGNGGTWLFGYSGTSGNEDISIGTQDGSGGRTITFATGGSAKMKILANGNIGIGAPDPGNYKLNVMGSIRANAVVVNTTGADFVFEPTYKLRPLAEVETFIKVNKHLPEVAPAADMQTNGVNVNELQTTLLQKVEELTLYSIELNKRLLEQEKENASLTKGLIEQKANYDALLQRMNTLTNQIKK